MFEATVLLCRQIDTLAKKRVPSYEEFLLYKQLSVSRKVKGRVLYYYPTDNVGQEDGWIGWHNDSGFLTALVSDMFFDDTTGTHVRCD